MGLLDNDHEDDAVAEAAAPVAAEAAEPMDVPRDERHDSIDPATGTLTAEAVELRRQMREASED